MKLYGSICLSDIPKEAITTGKNGKKYLQINIGERRTPSQWGHTHYVKVYARNVDPDNQPYIGDLKPSKWKPEQQQAQNASMPGNNATEYMVAMTKSAPAQPEQNPFTPIQEPDDLPY